MIKFKRYHTIFLGPFEIMVRPSGPPSRTSWCWVHHFLLVGILQWNVGETYFKGFTCFRWFLLSWGEKGPQASLYIAQTWSLSSGHAAGYLVTLFPTPFFIWCLRGICRSFGVSSWLTFKGELFFSSLDYEEVDISLTVMTDCRGCNTASYQMWNNQYVYEII